MYESCYAFWQFKNLGIVISSWPFGWILLYNNISHTHTCGPLRIKRVKLLTLYMYYTLFSGYHFRVFLFHHPLTCTSQGDWMWISAHSHTEKGVNTRLPCFYLPSCKSAGWICWNCGWEYSHCRVRVWVTHRSWFTWSSSWRNVAGSSRRMIRENTEFPLDAILKEESDISPVLREFGRFRCPIQRHS